MSADRRLIINADELGINSQRTHGIFQCMEFGVVRSATIVPNGSDADAAARHARERSISIGVQINLTDEYPLSSAGQISSLLEANGQFLGHDRFRTLLDDGVIELGHLEREMRAQVEWSFDSYGAPTHLTSHHDVHIVPAVMNVLLPILERYGIRNVRIPDESPLPPFGFEVPEDQLARITKANAVARAARVMYESHGIGSTDHFRGASLAGNASLKNLRHILSKLPEGTTELMVHPGSAITYGTPFDLDPQRQTELRMLLDESIPAVLAERKITLCSWADL